MGNCQSGSCATQLCKTKVKSIQITQSEKSAQRNESVAESTDSRTDPSNSSLDNVAGYREYAPNIESSHLRCFPGQSNYGPMSHSSGPANCNQISRTRRALGGNVRTDCVSDLLFEPHPLYALEAANFLLRANEMARRVETSEATTSSSVPRPSKWKEVYTMIMKPNEEAVAKMLAKKAKKASGGKVRPQQPIINNLVGGPLSPIEIADTKVEERHPETPPEGREAKLRALRNCLRKKRRGPRPKKKDSTRRPTNWEDASVASFSEIFEHVNAATKSSSSSSSGLVDGYLASDEEEPMEGTSGRRLCPTRIENPGPTFSNETIVLKRWDNEDLSVANLKEVLPQEEIRTSSPAKATKKLNIVMNTFRRLTRGSKCNAVHDLAFTSPEPSTTNMPKTGWSCFLGSSQVPASPESGRATRVLTRRCDRSSLYLENKDGNESSSECQSSDCPKVYQDEMTICSFSDTSDAISDVRPASPGGT